jgi:signal transduction histidine kinase
MRRSDIRFLPRHGAGPAGDGARDAQCASARATERDDERLAELTREAERRDLARELHDTVIQPLATLSTSFEVMRQQTLTPGVIEAYLGAWKELAQEALDSLRCALAGLHTHPHAQLGLPDALRRYLAPQVRGHGLRLTLEARDWPVDLPLDLTSSLYLVVRETLTNVEKHAHASEASILLEADAAELRIYLADNGVGFCQDEIARRAPARARGGNGLGLSNMGERIQALGGRFLIATAPGQGVRVELAVPRPSAAASDPMPAIELADLGPLGAVESEGPSHSYTH